MKNTITTALAATFALCGTLSLAPTAWAEDGETPDKAAVSITEAGKLETSLAARAALDARTIADDALTAASDLDLAVGLDYGANDPTSLLMANERR